MDTRLRRARTIAPQLFIFPAALIAAATAMSPPDRKPVAEVT